MGPRAARRPGHRTPASTASARDVAYQRADEPGLRFESPSATRSTTLETEAVTPPEAEIEDPAVDEVPDAQLPDDDEEFASPPPPIAESGAETS